MASLFENDMLNKIWNNFQSIQQNPMNLVDILLVAFVVYEILVVIRKTRAAQLAKGAVVVLVVYALANLMNLRTVVWIMQSVLQIGFLALIVLFQPELRRALEQMGRTDKWAATLFKNRKDDPSLRAKWQNACLAICDAAEQLSDTRTGALIVLERNSNLSEIIRTGTPLNADVNREMLGTIFYEGTPLHDGAVVVRDGVLKAAGCVLPLSDNLEIGKDMGTRHRAALGMRKFRRGGGGQRGNGHHLHGEKRGADPAAGPAEPVQPAAGGAGAPRDCREPKTTVLEKKA